LDVIVRNVVAKQRGYGRRSERNSVAEEINIRCAVSMGVSRIYLFEFWTDAIARGCLKRPTISKSHGHLDSFQYTMC
jgi:hypothetical protein